MGKRIFWDITDKCNLRCLHCSSSVHYKYSSPSRKDLNTQEAKKIIKKLAFANIQSIHFLGGEPLVRKDIYEILTYASEKIPEIILITNGTRIDESSAEKIINSGITRVGISFDGPTKKAFEIIRGKGNYDIVIKAIDHLLKFKEKFRSHITISLDVTLTKQSINLLQEYFKLIETSLPVDLISFSRLNYGIGEALRNIKLLYYSPEELLKFIEENLEILWKYLNSKKKPSLSLDLLRPLKRDYIKDKHGVELPASAYKCGGGISVGYIRSDGKLFPCRALSGDEEEYKDFFNDIEHRKSDLLIYDFYEIWNSKPFLKLFDLLYSEDTYNDYYPCNECEYLKKMLCRPCPLNIYLDKNREVKSIMSECILPK